MSDPTRGRILAAGAAVDALTLAADPAWIRCCDIHAVATGVAALRAAVAANPPELILLDAALSDIEAGELCRRLKAHVRTRGIPIIFVAAEATAAERVQALEAGASDYVWGPPDRAELLARVVVLLEQARLRRRLEAMLVENTSSLSASRDLLREVSVRRENAREDERRHIAREIHDDLGQMLGGVRLRLSTLLMQMAPEQEALAEQLRAIQGLTDQTIRVVRDVVSKLRTPVLDAGIVPALEWLLNDFRRSSGLQARLTLSSEDIELPDEIATALFRIAQESLTNVVRHASARQVEIDLRLTRADCRMAVRDDGRGFDPTQVQARSFGLEGMRERCLMVGGRLDLHSAPGLGSTVSVRFPIGARAAAPRLEQDSS